MKFIVFTIISLILFVNIFNGGAFAQQTNITVPSETYKVKSSSYIVEPVITGNLVIENGTTSQDYHTKNISSILNGTTSNPTYSVTNATITSSIDIIEGSNSTNSSNEVEDTMIVNPTETVVVPQSSFIVGQ